MCGIAGVFGRGEAFSLTIKALQTLKYRGKDGFGIADKKEAVHSKSLKSLRQLEGNNIIGHNFHSIVGHVMQPLEGKGKLVTNCEIYNWESLNKKYGFKAKNDAELLLMIIEEKGIDNLKETLDELDGVFALAYWFGDTLYLARDLIGLKPIWYSLADSFAFASEKKALIKIDYPDALELNPRKILKYRISHNQVEFSNREFFKTKPEVKGNPEATTEKLIREAIRKRLPEKKFGIMFSGGIDSTLLAQICKQLGRDFTCYIAALKDKAKQEPEDLKYSKIVAKKLGFNLKIVEIDLDDVEDYLKKIIPLIENTSVVRVGVALTLYAACEAASKDGNKVIFSGIGPEEIFAGYHRHKKSPDINQECLFGLLKLYDRDMYRDDVVAMRNNLELRAPFLDKKLVEYALRIPAKHKLNKDQDKLILRKIAMKLGIPKDIANRKKRAAQYGSNFDKALSKLARRRGHYFRPDYLKTFYPTKNLKLGVLFSSGKDSAYATYLLDKQNYEISCLITLKSKNPDSFMFHTPTVDLVKYQAEAMGVPLIEVYTEGNKEEELEDLKKAIKQAKKKYKIAGVATGAIESNYQRERVEKACDDLGLKTFAPLWHMEPETYMRNMLNDGFKIIVTKIAADGLDKGWLGKELTHEDVDRLIKMNKKNKIHIAFEGGEAETLMLDGPLFHDKKLKIQESNIVMESKICGELLIQSVKLVKK